MNDQEIQDWAEKLTGIRKDRRESIEAQIKDKQSIFKFEDFFKQAIRSLDEIVTEWWKAEQISLTVNNNQSTVDAKDFLQELDSLIEFELESLDRDFAYAKEQSNWDNGLIETEKKELVKYSEQLKSSFHIKIGATFNSKKGNESAKLLEINPIPSFKSVSSGSPRSAGAGLVLMFLIGLVLGLAPSLYFRSKIKEVIDQSQVEISQVQQKNKELEEGFSLYQESFKGLARGKGKNIPALETELSELKDQYRIKKTQINISFAEQKATALHRKEKGRPTALIEEIELKRKETLEQLEKQNRSEVESLTKQLEYLKQLAGH